MLDIKKIIFGIGEYSKVPFETRFEIITNYLSNNYNFGSIDKDIIKEIIYKIKELLRIKSSNLNKAIRDPKRKLTKKDVLNFVYFLESFVNHSNSSSNNINNSESYDNGKNNLSEFSNTNDISKNTNLKSKTIINKNENSEDDSYYENLNPNYKNSSLEKESQEKENNENNSRPNNLNNMFESENNPEKHIINRVNKELTFEGHRIIFKDSYLEIEGNVDLNFIKHLLSYTNESISNYNIIIRNNSTLIIPRLFKDDILKLNYTLTELNDRETLQNSLKNTYEKLTTESNNKKEDEEDGDAKNEDNLTTDKDNIVEDDKRIDVKNSDVISEDKRDRITRFVNKKLEEEKSLEDLINSIEKKEEEKNKVLDLSNKEPVEIKTEALKDKELNKELQDEILDFVPKNREKKIFIEKDEPIKIEEKKILDEVKDKFLIFEDDFVKISIKEILPLGTIEILLKKNDLEAFNYGFIYSKYLSSLVFQIVKCDGTNIIFENLKFTIYPRFNNDNIIDLPQKEATPDALTEIFKKLVEKDGGKKEKNLIKKKEEIKIEKEEKNEEIKDRAKLILEKLKRIP